MKPVLRAALLAVDGTLQSVAAALNLPEEVVGAYHDLWFNVLDQKNDFEYIARIVDGDDSRSMAFAREQAGVGPAYPMLAIARRGTLQDVLVAAGLSKAEELSIPAAAEKLRQLALGAAVAWFMDPRNRDKALPPVVALGLDLVKTTVIPPEPEIQSSMSEAFAEQFKEDADKIKADIELKKILKAKAEADIKAAQAGEAGEAGEATNPSD